MSELKQYIEEVLDEVFTENSTYEKLKDAAGGKIKLGSYVVDTDGEESKKAIWIDEYTMINKYSANVFNISSFVNDRNKLTKIQIQRLALNLIKKFKA